MANLTLLTDLYQLTMACGYWKAGIAERRAVFHLFFRRPPFGGAYAIAAGLEDALRYLESLSFRAEDRAYLASLEGADGEPLFPRDFLALLADLRCNLDVEAMPEGTAVFPHEPLLRISGPLLQAQLVETTLINLIGYQTLIATKAARVCDVARSADGTRKPVLEFGLRRSHGPEGGLLATRGAYIGGCSASSNVLAGRRFGIPVQGTHAHSWVMAFDTEREAFEAYAAAFPSGSVFLVDTYDTLEGVRVATEVGREMRAKGHEMVGVRLDSGDLAELSIGARRILDEAGFPDAKIVASNALDENRIAALEARGARIDVWGVGTRLSTAADQPSLNAVYKLGAVREAPEQEWEYRMKVSSSPAKRSIPGRLRVRRFTKGGAWLADAIYDDGLGLGDEPLVDPETQATFEVPADAVGEDLLVPVMAGGRRLIEPEPIERARERAIASVDGMPPELRERQTAARHFVGIDGRLSRIREAITEAHR